MKINHAVSAQEVWSLYKAFMYHWQYKFSLLLIMCQSTSITDNRDLYFIYNILDHMTLCALLGKVALQLLRLFAASSLLPQVQAFNLF